MSADTLSEENIFNILITTDNHLGYGEKKPIINEDSFRAFEEFLQVAVKKKVDFVLLGGDLFHDVAPSSYTLYKCMDLLKRYCLGDNPVEFEFLSDPSETFDHLKDPMVNYEDPNMNVAIPVFSIHGNHDNPSGIQQISGLDIIASSGLINYFGRTTDIKEVIIKPILLKKGTSKLAIYGLSHIADQRLARLFKDKKVSMPQPEGDWFNILVLHQNRANRGIKNFIPDEVIPSFINLVIWGHEHDCIDNDIQLPSGTWICQPGSSVATSLCEGEAQKKHMRLLKIFNQSYKMTAIPFKTVRPLMFKEVFLRCPETDVEYDMSNPQTQAMNDIKILVEELLRKAKDDQHGRREQLLPSIRMIVRYYSEAQTFNAKQLGFEFEGRVANSSTMFKLASQKLKERSSKLNLRPVDDNEFNHIDDWASRVEDVVSKYFQNHDRAAELSILSVNLLTSAVQKLVDAGDTEAISYAVQLQEKATLEKVIEANIAFPDLDDCLERIKKQLQQEENNEIVDFITKLNNKQVSTNNEENTSPGPSRKATNHNSDDDDGKIVESLSSLPQGRAARGRGRASGTSRRGTRGRRAAKN